MTESDILGALRAPGPAVGYFSTPACQVCAVLRPKVEQLAAGYECMRFVYVDTQAHPAMGGQHLVFAAPTIILFLDGKEVRRFSRNVSLAELDRYLGVLARETAM